MAAGWPGLVDHDRYRSRGLVRVEPGLKRVRGYLDGHVVVDSTDVRLVWEKPYYPTWYFPVGDVTPGALVATGRTRHSPSRGEADLFDLAVGDRVAERRRLPLRHLATRGAT